MYAFLCALTWSSYSVISRTFSHIPTSVVGAFYGIVAILSWSAHFIFEKSVTPTYIELFVALMLGLGPVGGAFIYGI